MEPGKPPANLSRAGSKPGSLGLSGTAGLQFRPKPGLARPQNRSGGGIKGAGSSLFRVEDEDEFDDDASERARVSRELQRGVGSSTANRSAVERMQAEALVQDASIFDYDGAYDQMQQQRTALRQASKAKEDKSAKYIGSILQAHKVREIENEKVFERKLVKEAEAVVHTSTNALGKSPGHNPVSRCECLSPPILQ